MPMTLDTAAIKALVRRARRFAGGALSPRPKRPRTAASTLRSSGKDAGGFAPFERRGGVVTNGQIDRLRADDAY
jgi:hypothetical protein